MGIGYLTEEWSPSAYISLAHAAVADAFKNYLYSKKTLYVIENPEDNRPLVKHHRDILLKKIRAYERRRDRLVAEKGYYKGSAISFDIMQREAKATIIEVERFVHSGTFALYTDVAPSVFFDAVTSKMKEWEEDDGRSINKKSLVLSHNRGVE